jgi:hypothetical protein
MIKGGVMNAIKWTRNVIVAILLLLTIGLAQKSIDWESGVVISGYNNVQIPRATGTFIALNNKHQIETRASFFYRVRFSYSVNDKHIISILYAPLKLYGGGELSTPVSFESVTFPLGTPLKTTYVFNSYRLTYRYEFYNTEKMKIGLGLTAKIRDAEIKLASSDISARKTNIGFVPIINFNLERVLFKSFTLIINGDALAAPQGRAEDIMTALRYELKRNIKVRVGYRILEGGADVEEVYNFALFHYGLIGLDVSI